LKKTQLTAKLLSKVRQPYNTNNIREDVQSLFKLGYFNDIEVNREVSGKDVALTFKVVENLQLQKSLMKEMLK